MTELSGCSGPSDGTKSRHCYGYTFLQFPELDKLFHGCGQDRFSSFSDRAVRTTYANCPAVGSLPFISAGSFDWS